MNATVGGCHLNDVTILVGGRHLVTKASELLDIGICHSPGRVPSGKPVKYGAHLQDLNCLGR
jgi:hypothetical protein